MAFTPEEASQTLQYVSDMSVQGRTIIRYLGNPHVTRKDSVHEHIARITRFATIILPLLRAEFAHDPAMLEELNHLQTMVCVHDDEEILQRADIATFAKQHDSNNDKEIALIRAHLGSLTATEREYVLKYFILFRKRKELEGAPKKLADIAKVLDNLVGNQLAIEDQVGLIQPDYTICCLDYIRPYEGQVCKTMDVFIQAQLKQMLAMRESMRTDGTIGRLATLWAGEQKNTYDTLIVRIRDQLAVNLDTHTFDKTRCHVPVWKYQIAA